VGRATEAVPHLVAALAIRPGPDSESDLARALGAIDRWEDAIPHLESALQASPNRDDLRIRLGEAYSVTGAWKRARAEYEGVLRSEPASAEAHYNFANLPFREGMLDEAVAHCEAMLRLQPDLAEAQHNLAVALMGLGPQTKRSPISRRPTALRQIQPKRITNLLRPPARCTGGGSPKRRKQSPADCGLA
jgi:tetratricopeptide (TPR) repeat protein